MSTCYLLPMSHEWPSFRDSLEPLSPTSTATENREAVSLQYGTSTQDSQATTHAAFSAITWPSNYSLAQSPALPVSSPNVSAASVSTPALSTSHCDQQEQEPQQQVTREGVLDVLGVLKPRQENRQDVLKEEDDDIMSASDLDEIAEDETVPQTAAERRAAKRKMKRFRLTHNQTRFLLSEFARQPHPDAAQRERLSREIPGLSSRQVQVWFQNRRAKLKRLSVDDRERMMRSRALPENFDRSSALHTGLQAVSPVGGVMVSPSYRTLMTGFQPMAHPKYGHMRRPSDDPATSPSSNPSIPSESLWTTGSMPASEMQSPTSPIFERGHAWGPVAAQIPSPQTANPHARSRSFPALYQGQPQSWVSGPQDQLSRLRTGSLASPVAVGFNQAAPVPMAFGRPCPPAPYDYSHPILPVQPQSASPEAHFAIPPSPGMLRHPQPQSQQQRLPFAAEEDFARQPFPEQYPRPIYSSYAAQYPTQYTFEATLPQTSQPEGAGYQPSRASISGPPTQQDIVPDNGTQRQQLRINTGRRRSFTHPPDYKFPR